MNRQNLWELTNVCRLQVYLILTHVFPPYRLTRNELKQQWRWSWGRRSRFYRCERTSRCEQQHCFGTKELRMLVYVSVCMLMCSVTWGGRKNTWKKDEGWWQNGRQEGHKHSTSWMSRKRIIAFVSSKKVSKNMLHAGQKRMRNTWKATVFFKSLIMTLNQYGVCIHVSVIRFSIWSRDWRASRLLTLLNWSDSLTF